MVEWTGRQTRDADTFSLVLQAKADGTSVSVYISDEALEDHGVDACKAVAEEKISSASAPRRVDVTNADFT